MSRSVPRPNYVGDTPIHIDGKHDSVTYIREDPWVDYPGRKYPEFMLIKFGEADSFDQDWYKHDSEED